MLLRALPRESATVRAVAGERAEWGVAEYLLADAVDVLALANWQRSDTKKNPTRPKPIPRPGHTRRDPLDVRARLLDQRKRLRR